MGTRDDNGRFEKGASGNPNGRPRKIAPRHRRPEANRAAIFEVAEMPVIVRAETESIEVTVYKANVLALANRGAKGHVAAAKAFLQLADGASSVYGDTHAVIGHLFRELARLEGLVEKYEAIHQKQKHGVLVIPQEEWDRRTNALHHNWSNRKQRGFT